jgi:hypothetical protein
LKHLSRYTRGKKLRRHTVELNRAGVASSYSAHDGLRLDDVLGFDSAGEQRAQPRRLLL